MEVKCTFRNISISAVCEGYQSVLVQCFSDLQGREVMVNQEGQAANRDNQELHSERVVVPIISRLELQVDQVHSGVRTSDVNDLKDADNTMQITKDEPSLACREYKQAAMTH